MSDHYICRTLREEDDAAVRRLVETAFPVFTGGGFWDWKYLRNPSFDRSLIAVAENSGEIVGCNHWIKRKFRLNNSMTVDSLLGANIAVLPKYRRLGVGRALINFLRSKNKDLKPPIMYMFADPELRKRFHARVAGYVPSLCCTVSYVKILNWNRIRPSVARFNQRVKNGEFKDRLAEADFSVAFRIRGAPPLCFRLDKNGVDMDVPEQSADVVVSTNMLTSNVITDRGSKTRTLIKAMLTGKLRIRGAPLKLVTASKYMWVFRQILSKNST